MLAAWMRMKYPGTVVGALASSAPILQFGDLVPCNTFAHITTQDYQAVSADCADSIHRSWSVMADMWKDQAGRDSLRKTFPTCQPLDDRKIKLTDFQMWLFSGWIYMVFR